MDAEPTVELQLGTTLPDVLVLAIGLAIVVWFLWVAYRTMQRPRLPVIRKGNEPPRATWPGVLRYALTTPPMVLFWVMVFLMMLASASIDRDADQVAAIAAAIVGAARLLAHIHEETAHELGKTVPIVILGFILIGGGFSGTDQFDDILSQMSDATLDTYIVGLILFDFVVTSAWFLVQRLRHQRHQRRRTAGKPEAGIIERAWQRWRTVGYN